MNFKCHECGREVHATHFAGQTPITTHLNYYCDIQCLANNVEKNKPKANA